MPNSIRAIPHIRGRDSQGCGYFGASRSGGARTHNGVDFLSPVASAVLAFFPGKVTKIGQAYSDPEKSHFRYVEVQDERGLRARYFYIEPIVTVGEYVQRDAVLGVVQELPYAGIQAHYHFEVRKGTEILDPLRYLCGDA